MEAGWMMDIEVKRMSPGAKLPTRSYDKSLAYDLYHENLSCVIEPGSRVLLRTGIAIKIPGDYGGILKDRSGMALEHGLHVMAGVIDADYRGEIKVLMLNTSQFSVRIKPLQKLAQMICVITPPWGVVEVDELDVTERNDKGFGSSDKSCKE
jgi:dUTP pyrophosphatase